MDKYYLTAKVCENFNRKVRKDLREGSQSLIYGFANFAIL